MSNNSKPQQGCVATAEEQDWDTAHAGETVSELYLGAVKRLQTAGIEDAGLDARLLLQHITGWDWAKFLMEQQSIAQAELCRHYRQLISMRAEHIPLQYLTGEQEFMGIPFRVTRDVLIPRQDTELLVELALPFCKGGKVLDLCTGSGCILVSLAKNTTLSRAVGADISTAALAVAKDNADRQGVSAEFVESDLFASVEGTFDVIVSNPPYITKEEMKELMPEVLEHEPHLALYGGEDGLAIYRRLVPDAKKHLGHGGRLLVEIGCGQGEAVSGLFLANGYREVRVCRDYAGHDRVVMGRLQQ